MSLEHTSLTWENLQDSIRPAQPPSACQKHQQHLAVALCNAIGYFAHHAWCRHVTLACPGKTPLEGAVGDDVWTASDRFLSWLRMHVKQC